MLDASSEYYYPTHASRRIHSGFLNGALGGEVIAGTRLYALAGMTFTFADGNIEQFDEHFDSVRSSTVVGGMGPIFLLRGQPVQWGPWSLGLEMLGGIVLYSRAFPPGGDIYNFTWRFGAAIAYRIVDGVQVNLGVRWMHVSNGQGLGAQNPSYAGIGFPIGLTLRL